MMNKTTKHFIIENNIGELSELAEKIKELAGKWKLTPALTKNINLVLEEALSNIIYYAFNDNREHEIKISLFVKDNCLTIKITDDGIFFDPTARQQPDMSLLAEERPVGGLGIFLISKIMDTVYYSRQKNLNTLTLTKKLI
jgi:serine/threonine-protein kinase RsbW